ncbi:MAG: radical SAM protein [Nitrospirota bacterium]
MNILLIYPASDNAFSKVGFILPPLGLGYIASVLRNAGHKIKIYDFNIQSDNLNFDDFDIVGISANTSRHKMALQIARQAQKMGLKVVMGGPHVTFMDKETIMDDGIDYVVRNEGEETFLELVNAIEGEKALDDIKGISYKKNGQFKRNPDRPAIRDIDTIPLPARDLMAMDKYITMEMAKRKITSIITSRGCPLDCSFCASSFSSMGWRARRVDLVVNEIEQINNKYGFSGIAFLDDNFTMKPSRTIEISKEIIKRGLDIKWWCFSRVDTIAKNEEMIKWMSESGCRHIFMGIESVNQDVLNSYNKKYSADKARQAVEMLRDYKIETMASFIFGDIKETKNMMLETIKYAKKLNPGSAQFTILTPYPGTRLYNEIKDRLITDDWDKYDCMHPVVRLDHVSSDELQKILFGAYKAFYLRPSRIITSLLSSIRGKGVKIGKVKNLISTLKDG